MTDYLRQPWWPIVKFITDAGHDCVVMDPEAAGDDILFDEVEGHGKATVVPWPGCGWVVTTGEHEAPVDPDLIPGG